MKRKHMKLPNGFGQITKLSKKNLRRPYRAMVTVGVNKETGKPIQKLLKPVSYFETYNEAYTALIDHNRTPEYKGSELTLEQLYEEWSEEYYKSLKPNSIQAYTSAWKNVQPWYDLKISIIGSKRLKEIVLDCSDKDSIVNSVKLIFNAMFDYAVENEYLDRNPARLIRLGKNINLSVKKEHVSFSDEEIKLLWANSSNKFARRILINIYTGFRPSELLNIKISNINLDEMTIIGGMKTRAGTNRTVPIHPCILELLKTEMYESNEYLFSKKDSPMSYGGYKLGFSEFLNKYNLNVHTPHDARKTFVTLAKQYKMDEYAIKRIVGHEIKDITERVYTDRSIDWLKTEIEKIKVYE